MRLMAVRYEVGTFKKNSLKFFALIQNKFSWFLRILK